MKVSTLKNSLKAPFVLITLLVFLFITPNAFAKTQECIDAKTVWEFAKEQFHTTKRQIKSDFKSGLIEEDTKDLLIDAEEATKDAAEAVKDAVCDVEDEEEEEDDDE